MTLCKNYGADELINYETEDLKNRIKELTNGKGANVVFDPVGAHYSEPAIRAMAWKGRFLIVGFAAGVIPKIPLNLMLLKGCELVGVFWGRFTKEQPGDNLTNSLQIMNWHREGKVKPHIHKTYPLESAAIALNEMMSRKVIGKVVLTM